MKKIIHLSDIHVGYEKCHEKFIHIVNKLIEKIENPKDHIVLITGDLNDDANQANYQATLIQINRLREVEFTVLVVPGNHDYYRWLNLTYADKKFVKEFKKTFWLKGEEKTKYPRLDIIGQIAFIGLDSMEGELGFFDKFGADGEFEDDQLERLKNILDRLQENDRVLFTVLYFHHHIWDNKTFHKLKDADELVETIKPYKIDAILFGHKHEGNSFHNKLNVKRIYDAGSSTKKKPNDKCFHRLIELVKDVSEDKELNLLGDYNE